MRLLIPLSSPAVPGVSSATRMAGGGSTCDDVPSAVTSDAVTTLLPQHATKHADGSSHPVIASFEPGEDWFYDYRSDDYVAGPPLPPANAPSD